MSKKSVLIVEDEIITAMEIESYLKSLGHSIRGIVNSGEKAVKRIAENGIDLILMDIKLKGRIDGIEATEQIKSISSASVIFITAFGSKKQEVQSRLTGSYGFLTKPFDKMKLKSAIEAV